MANATLTAEEFERWEPIKRALTTVLLLAPHTCIDILKARIRSGSIAIAAKEFRKFNERGRPSPPTHLMLLDASRWIDHVDERFWDVGDHTVRVRRENTGYGGTRIEAEI